MSSWAKPGVQCVCVDDHEWGFKYLENLRVASLPKRGGRYLIREVRFRENAFAGVRLQDLDNSHIPTNTGEEVWFRMSRFRPLISQADDIAMFQKLVDTMKPTERLDVLRELLDTTPS